MTVYADTSFLVSVYVEDRHSSMADRLLGSAPPIVITPLHLAEWADAVSQQVFRRQMSPQEATKVHQEFEKDIQSGLWIQAAMPDQAFDLCADLARRYGPKLGIRTLDSLHVACALELRAEQFWTFDERQAKLAKAAGLKTT
ncbi:MAG TPA: type II toxin-antitoxin system VapC family toxin [Terriglobales bacterium]|nr:type II toxin-antitoxin system VapC family toxin [Terriglobales bacterium]